jgi:hypothetical protein
LAVREVLDEPLDFVLHRRMVPIIPAAVAVTIGTRKRQFVFVAAIVRLPMRGIA